MALRTSAFFLERQGLFTRGDQMAKLRSSQFTFRKNDTVGAEGAELDHLYLADCFYDHGDLDIIRDCSNPSCIIVGRTGSGKTALMMKLQEYEENIISLEPE